MKKQHILFIVILLSFSIALPMLIDYLHENIEDYEEVAVKPKKKVEFKSKNSIYTIRAKSKNKWVYFNFSKGSAVDIKNESSLDWDIAFKRTNFKSNGGATNRKGKVGIINLGHVDINSIEVAPESGYVQDSKWFGTILNNELNKWYKYSTQYHRVTSKLDVYIIRTVDGKYAKMKILYYYCTGGESACLTIEYFYQPDGTKNLKNTSDTINIRTNSG